MRAASPVVTLLVALGGCAVTERQSLGYGDYAGFNCDQLGQEAVRLMREAANRSEHILENDQARRERALRQLQAVRKLSAEKRC